MGSKVFANGLAVATTKSGHIAMNTEGVIDWRLQGTTPVPRLSEIASTQLKKDASAKTEFGGGKVWRQPTECGAPSISRPDDKLPGKENGAVVNGEIVTATGAGSPNVFVEGAKVECQSHATKQNRGAGGMQNSPGEIVDEARAAAIRKQFDAFLAEWLRNEEEKKKAAIKKAAETVARQLEQTKTNPAAPVKVDTNKLNELGIVSVVVRDGGRKQGDDAGTVGEKLGAGPYLEVLATSTITIEVEGPGKANAIIVTPAGTRTPPIATYQAGNKANAMFAALSRILGPVDQSLVVSLIYAACRDYLAYGEDSVAVTAGDGSAGAFSRQVFVYPVLKLSFADLETGPLGAWKKTQEALIERVIGLIKRVGAIGGPPPEAQLAFLIGTFSLSAAFEEEEGKNVCPFVLKAALGCDLLRAALQINLPLENLFPAAKPVVALIKDIVAWFGVDVKGVYAFGSIKGNLKVEGEVALKVYRSAGKPSEKPGKVAVGGGIEVGLGIALQLTEAVKGSAGIYGLVTASYDVYPTPGSPKVEAALELRATFEIKLGFLGRLIGKEEYSAGTTVKLASTDAS